MTKKIFSLIIHLLLTLMKIIFFGDLVGKISRKALKQILPEWRKKYAPDFVIANGENLAHGIGITKNTFNEIIEAGVDIVTSGDHAFDKDETWELLENESRLLRPANFPPDLPGQGDFSAVDSQKSLLMINLVGRVFMHKSFDCPFRKLDEVLEKHKNTAPKVIIVDFHAEATSEKAAFGFYADGRVSAVLGTHTHVGTTDAKILPKGTAFISDIGMVGAVDSVIGADKAIIIQSFLSQTKFKPEPIESGACQINAVILEINEKTGETEKIERIDEEIYIADSLKVEA